MAKKTEAFEKYLVGCLHVFFREIFIQSKSPFWVKLFSQWLVYFRSFYILDTNPLQKQKMSLQSQDF